MNIALSILWLIVTIGCICLVVLSHMAMNAWTTKRNVVVPDGITHCAVALDTLVSVEHDNCCFVGDTLTASRYVESLDMVVNPTPTPYLNVCKGFCTNGAINDTTCKDDIGQAAFDRCILLTIPKDGCLGVAMPVAALGISYFYGNSATNAACKDTRPCK